MIAGHHAGLADFETTASLDEGVLARRLVKNKIPPYRESLELHMPHATGEPIPLSLSPGFDVGMWLSMFIRMLFSCVVDADSLDAERYANHAHSDQRGGLHLCRCYWNVLKRTFQINLPLPSMRSISFVRSCWRNACPVGARAREGCILSRCRQAVAKRSFRSDLHCATPFIVGCAELFSLFRTRA